MHKLAAQIPMDLDSLSNHQIPCYTSHLIKVTREIYLKQRTLYKFLNPKLNTTWVGAHFYHSWLTLYTDTIPVFQTEEFKWKKSSI